MDRSKIEWTDATWNPITGCSRVSRGCEHCYAERLAGTRMKNEPSRRGLTRPTEHGPVWTGEVRRNADWLDQPLRWKRPRRIFVCAHSDLFHENVPELWIDQVFAVMAAAPQHTFQVLTKRAERMREYLTGRNGAWVEGRISDMLTDRWDRYMPLPVSIRTDSRVIKQARMRLLYERGWPLPNVWLGVSAEDQATANGRIPLLLQTPAIVRWVSLEPLLGPVNLSPLHCPDFKYGERQASIYALHGKNSYQVPASHWRENFPKLDWCVVGGESGPGSRPMHPAWVRSLRTQCVAAGVPYFLKQWGDWLHFCQPDTTGRLWETDGKEFIRVGKKVAGRTLDGRTWEEYPA